MLGEIVVPVFEKHRLVVIGPKYQFSSSEGSLKLWKGSYCEKL